jgi:hypothetical protein
MQSCEKPVVSYLTPARIASGGILDEEVLLLVLCELTMIVLVGRGFAGHSCMKQKFGMPARRMLNFMDTANFVVKGKWPGFEHFISLHFSRVRLL